MLKFVKRQINYLKKGQYSALLMFLWFPLSFPAVLMMRLCRPWLLIRLFNFAANSMGGFIRYPDYYQRCERLGLCRSKQRTLDFFYLGPKVANDYVAVLWERIFNGTKIYKNGFYWFFNSAEWLNTKIPGGELHDLSQVFRNYPLSLLESVPPYINLADNEEALGRAGLIEIGIPEGAPLVGLLVRDSAYWTSFQPEIDDSINSPRNGDIDDFVMAAEELARRGYYVVRMGAKVAKPWKNRHEKIIDYASSSFRNEFMDVYISKRCSFFISTACGFDLVPSCLFRRPMVIVNLAGVFDIMLYMGTPVFSTKTYVDRCTGDKLSIKQVCDRGLGYTDGRYRSEAGERSVYCIENSPEEILDTIVEATERLQGIWQPHPGDEELQKRFWSYFPSKEREIPARFSASFLRKNHEWFLT